MLKSTWNDNSGGGITVYAIPKSRKDEFITDKNLVLKSLDAKSLYEIDMDKYETNPELFDAEMNRAFDNFETYMLGSSADSK